MWWITPLANPPLRASPSGWRSSGNPGAARGPRRTVGRSALPSRPSAPGVLRPWPERLKARDFRCHVVGLDVEVDPALVLHPLDLHDRLVGRGLQHPVVAARARMAGVDRSAQRLGPESRRGVDVVGLAVDQHGAKTGMVHVGYSSGGSGPLYETSR